MADKREVFTIVEDNSTAEGIKLPGRAQGDVAGSNHIPAMVAKDTSGNYQLVPLRDAGDAVSGVDSLPVLAVKDLAGNFQYINARDEGDAKTGVDALPAMVAIDASSNFKYLRVNVDGELVPIVVNENIMESYQHLKRFNVIFPAMVLKKIDSFRKKKGLKRSAFLQKAAEEYLQQHDKNKS